MGRRTGCATRKKPNFRDGFSKKAALSASNNDSKTIALDRDDHPSTTQGLRSAILHTDPLRKHRDRLSSACEVREPSSCSAAHKPPRIPVC
jgi:hypothetical protein